LVKKKKKKTIALLHHGSNDLPKKCGRLWLLGVFGWSSIFRNLEYLKKGEPS
jgi:hypothetical protein